MVKNWSYDNKLPVNKNLFLLNTQLNSWVFLCLGKIMVKKIKLKCAIEVNSWSVQEH